MILGTSAYFKTFLIFTLVSAYGGRPTFSLGVRRHSSRCSQWDSSKPRKLWSANCELRGSGKEKAHKHKLCSPVALGTTPGLSQGQTGFVPGTNPLCPRDKPRFLLILHNGSTVCPWDKHFVPGTFPGTKGGRNSLCVKIGRPQMWERVQVGFGSTGKKRKGPCTKQCA